MTKLAFTFGFFFTILTCLGQSYLGRTSKKVNFRSGPGTEFNIITSLNTGSQIFIVSLETENDFYNVIDIATDREGYIHKSYVKIGEKVNDNEEGLFVENGKSSTVNPQIDVYNNTAIKMTLKLNNEIYTFSPHERKSITSVSGKCSYRASAQGVIPSVGAESLKSGMLYSWEFYIVTQRK